MDSKLILLSLGLALTAWVLARGLSRTHRLPLPGEPAYAAVAADQSARVAGFLAFIFALKILPLLVPATGLLRRDFLFPLWALWRRGDGAWWLLPAFAVGLGLAALAFRPGCRRLSPAVFAALTMAGAALLWLSLCLTNGGWPEGLVEPLLRGADYYVDVERFSSPADIWRHYVARQESLSLHGRTHPPGALTLLWVLDRATGGRAGGVSLAVVLISTLGLIPMFVWARCFLSERGARAAVILWTLTPAVALYGATSLDMVFAVPLMAAGALFAMALTRTGSAGRLPWLLAAAAGFFLALGFLFTFSAAVLAATWVATMLLLPRQIRRHGFAVLITAGATCVFALALVTTLTGLDLVDSLRVAMSLDAAEAPATLSLRYYLLTRLMGIMDFLVLAGVALSPVWIHVLWRGMTSDMPAGPEGPPAGEDRHDAVLLALTRGMALAVGFFLALGAYKIGETGRIFLFLLPMMILPAARRLSATGRATATGLWVFTLTALWHLGQTALMEWFLDTRW